MSPRRYIGAIAFVAPALLVYLAFSIWPAINTLYYSMLDWDGLNAAEWVGFENYAKVFTEPELFNSILHSLVLVFFFAVLPIALGLLLAGLLTGAGTRGLSAFRVIFFIPQVIPLVAVGIAWRWLYAEDGPLNEFLETIGLGGLATPWLASTDTALIALGLVGTWGMSGLCMMLFISGAQKIDSSLYEAAAMDGAGPIRRFISVTLPGLRGEVDRRGHHDDRRALQLRPHLRDHERWSRERHDRSRPARLPARLHLRPDRPRGGTRGGPDSADPGLRLRDPSSYEGESMKSSRVVLLSATRPHRVRGRFLFPFVGIVLAAFRGDSEDGGTPTPAYVDPGELRDRMGAGKFSDLMLSSVVVGVIVVPSTLILATLAGYGLAVLRPTGHSAIMTAFVIGLTLPTELVIIALYYNLDSIGFTNNYVGVGLAEVALFLPFSVYWMHTHFSGMPRELIESGRIDGASDWRILRELLLPISKPALTTLIVLLFIWAWNQFLLVLVLMQSPTRRTAVAGLGYFVGEYGTDIPMLAAASLIVIAPVVVVYLIFQRSFVAGITQGAIKG